MDDDRASTPRWVKVSALVALVIAVLVVILLITGGGGRHSPSRHALPAGVPTQGAPQL